MNLLKKYLIWLPLLVACNNSHYENVKKNENSEDADKVLINGPIREELLAKDTAIINYLKAFNEIQENLDSIKSKERIIALNSGQNELPKQKKDIIINDIKLIYDLLVKNRETMASMKKQLEDSKIINIEIDKINVNLIRQVLEQESEIADLKKKLNKLNIELDYLNLSYQKAEKESDKKTDDMNTGYFTLGTYEGLLDRGFINKEGGFIGIGKIETLNPNFNKNIFSAIDITKTKEISIAAKNIKLLTLHPVNSYKITDNGLHIQNLTIIDPNEFWRTSKYLVLQVAAEEPAKIKNKAKDFP